MRKIRSYIFLFLALLASPLIMAQDDLKPILRDTSQTKPFHKVYWGLAVGAGNVAFTNSLTETVIDQKNSYSAAFFIEYHPIRYIAIETGAEYFMLNSSATLDAYNSTTNAIDSNGDPVEYRFSAKNVSEDQKISLLNIPIALKGILLVKKWEFYARAGVVVRNSLNSTYSQRGTYTNNGYYEQYDLLITDLPDYGYYTNLPDSEEAEIAWKTTIDPVVGVGIVFPSKTGSFFIEGNFYPGGANFFENKQAVPFQSRIGNTNANEQKTGSLLESGSTKLSGFAVSIGLRF